MKSPKAIELAPILKDTGGALLPGEIYLANESRLDEANFSEPLTTYALGWRDPNNIKDTLDFVAPEVPTTRKFEYAKATNAEEFLSDGTGSEDMRSIGSPFGNIEYTSAKATGKTHNKGLTIRVDLDNVTGMPDWRNIYTRKIVQRLLRNELRRAITLLAAAANNTAKTWDTSAGKDPDQDVATALIAYTDDAGILANRILFGTIPWNKRSIAHRAQDNAGGYASAGLTPEQLANNLGVEMVKISRERYVAVGSSATKSKVVGDVVLIYNAQSGQTPEDPSNIKRFTSATDGGQAMRVYEQQMSAKFIDITVEHYSDIVVTSTLGIQKLTIS